MLPALYRHEWGTVCAKISSPEPTGRSRRLIRQYRCQPISVQPRERRRGFRPNDLTVEPIAVPRSPMNRRRDR